jgi:hypothetical protein
MKKQILAVGFFLASCLLLPAPSFAQFTTVTATVQDPNGIPYAGAILNAVLVPGASGGYTLSGSPYAGRIGPVTLDSAGKFTVNFGDVTLITPGSPQWQITIDSASATIAGPLGTGPQSFTFTSTGTTISGSSPVSLTTALNAIAPKLTNFITGGTGTVTSIAATSPVVVTPNPITATGTISCPTCSTSSSTVPINQVVSATGAITPIAIAGNPLEFDCSNSTPGTFCYIFNESSASTAGRLMEITTLNGSAAQALTVTSGAAGPAGTNAPNAVGITTSNGGAAGASQNGFKGGGAFWTVGAGSAGGATTGTGGAGGDWIFGGGDGGAAGGTSANAGGNGGVFNVGLGVGGNGNATGNGGNAGVFNLNTAGTGGNGGATSGTGGAGADINITSGTGGTAAVGSTTGRGGNITLSLGAAGATGTAGAPGRVLINRATGPTGSTTTPLLDIVDVWNTSGIVDAGIRLNIQPDTSSGTGSLLIDLQDASVSKFKVDKAGNLTAAGTLAGTRAIPAVVSGATSGGIPCFDSTTDMNTTAAITVNDAITGGGAGACAKDSNVVVYRGARTAETSNLAVGNGALSANGSGTDTHETAIGFNSLHTESGSGGNTSNTAIGWSALTTQNGPSFNTAVGANTLNAVTTGGSNTAIGASACVAVTNGSSDICIGTSANVSGAADTNEIMIGGATGAGSNTATIGTGSTTDIHHGGSADAAIVHGKSYATATNCSSSASPAVCGSASAGSAALPTNAVSSSIVVNTTAVTANSQIFVQTDDTLGTKLGVTCNSTVATLVGGLTISARTAGTSFTIANNVAVVTNPLCVSYFLVN